MADLSEQPAPPSPALREIVERLNELETTSRTILRGAPINRDGLEAAAALLAADARAREAERKYRVQAKATSDACNIADDESDRADKAEADLTAAHARIATLEGVLIGVDEHLQRTVTAEDIQFMRKVIRSALAPAANPVPGRE